MPKEYTSEQLRKLYEKLPKELQEALFSWETIDSLYDICEKNEITRSEQISEIARCAGQVLLGILSPDEFQEVLEKKVKLKKEVAKKVAREINRFIFYPVKPALEETYKVPITPPPAGPTAGPKVASKPEATAPSEEKPPTPPREDVYREPIE